MSKKILFALVAVMLLSAMIVPAAFAQSATNQAWVSSIAYYTPSDSAGTLSVSFYAEGSATPITLPDIALPAHASGQLLVGGVSTLPTGFKGSAVLSSDVYVVSAAVQFAADPDLGNYGRLIYTGFSDADAAAQIFIPTLLNHKFGFTSTLAIQNTESFEVTANVKVYAAGSTTPVKDLNYDIPAQSDKILGGASNAGDLMPADFTGSAVITGAKKGDAATAGKLVASVQETMDSGREAYAFEGVSAGADTIYMPSIACEATSQPVTSYFAIQNVSMTNTASVSIDFYDTTGALIGNMPAKSLAPGAKLSENPCPYGVAVGKLGSAVIKSTGANIIAMGKMRSKNGIGGVSTAFLGLATGATKVALPFVRWAATTSSDYSTYIAVMNIGSAPATNVQAKYYDANGNLKGTETLATAGSPINRFIKKNTTAMSAGALTGGTFGYSPLGGAVEITSDQPVAVVVRAQKDVVPALGTTTRFAEDYNGIAVP